MNQIITLNKTIIEIGKEFQKFEIIKKDSSKLMKAINLFLVIMSFGTNRNFMKNFVTTIGQKVYVPNGWDKWVDEAKIGVLRHERVHMRQSKRLTPILYSIIYLFLPVPFFFAYGRAKLEWEAYTESIKTRAELCGIDSARDKEYRDKLIKNFTGPSYLFMFPFKKTLNKWYDKVLSEIEAGDKK
jgi:hypothetical protein